MPIATMATGNEQLKKGVEDWNAPASETKRPTAERLAKFEQGAKDAEAVRQRGKENAARDAAQFAARMEEMIPSPAEAIQPASPEPAAKKGLFSRIGGWFKNAFEPSIEEQSAAHAQTEAAKNPLVAQQMRDMADSAPMSKAEFSQTMKESAARLKAEKAQAKEAALKAQSAAIGELGIVGHNKAFGNLGAEEVAVAKKAESARVKQAASEAKAALGRLSPIEKPVRTTDEKTAERMLKKGDAELMEMIDAGEDPTEAAAFLASARKDASKAKRTAVVEGAKKVAYGVGQTLDKGMSAAWKKGDRAVDTAISKLTRGESPADRDARIMDAAKGIEWANPADVMEDPNAGDQALSDAQILAEQSLSDRREKQRKAEGSTAFSKKKPGYATTALSGIMKAGQYVREQTKRGPTVSEAVNAVVNADLHGAGMKAVDTTLDAAASAADAMAKLGLQSWEAVKRNAEKLRITDQDLTDAGVKLDMEDVPDEIAEVVAETAAERQEGPQNFVEVFDDMKALATSDNRSRKAAFAAEATILKDLAEKGGDPNEYLGAIGDKFRGWTAKDVNKLVQRLYKTRLLAK